MAVGGLHEDSVLQPRYGLDEAKVKAMQPAICRCAVRDAEILGSHHFMLSSRSSSEGAECCGDVRCFGLGWWWLSLAFV
jgi:hypothetical protein